MSLQAAHEEIEQDNTAQDEGANRRDTVAGVRLKSFLDRIERLTEEKQDLSDDIKEVFAEAKGVGFDAKTMRTLLRLKKMDPQKRREADDILALYMAAIGME
jgi:uncharacterized protein (UPF0335 family)